LAESSPSLIKPCSMSTFRQRTLTLYILFPGGRKICIDMSDLDSFVQKDKKIFD